MADKREFFQKYNSKNEDLPVLRQSPMYPHFQDIVYLLCSLNGGEFW